MRQRLMLDPHTECITTVEGPEVIAGKVVAYSPSRDLPRSRANWERHKACMVAAPALADLLEELRELASEYLKPDGKDDSRLAFDFSRVFNRPDVIALLEDIKQQ